MCAKCGNHRFELRQIEPTNGGPKQPIVQCDSCGAPVGIASLQDRLADIEARVANIESYLAQVARALQDK